MNTEVLFSSEGDLWRTPTDFINWLGRRFDFTLDAAADDAFIAPRYITAEQDALITPWEGTVFCNPPYSKVDAFVKRAVRESQRSYCEGIVMLVPARTDTRWFHEHFDHWNTIDFLKGRLKFWLKEDELAAVNAARLQRGRKPLSSAANSAPFPSMLLIVGNGEATYRARYGHMTRITVTDWKRDYATTDL